MPRRAPTRPWLRALPDQAGGAGPWSLVAFGFDQRIHVVWIEPIEFQIFGPDHIWRREGHEVEHALAANLEVHRDTVPVACIAAERLSSEVLGDIAQLIP